MAGREAVACAHRGSVCIGRTLDGGEALIHNGVVERVALPPGEWLLDFDEDSGFAYISRGDVDLEEKDNDAAMWADSLFRRALYKRDDGELLLLRRARNDDDQDVVMDLKAEKHAFELCELKVFIAGTQGHFVQHFAIFELEHCGARLFWQLSDLYMVGGLHDRMAKTPSRWVHRRWKAWERFLTEMQCPSGLLRSAKIGDDGDDVGPPPRVLPFPSAPTFAFLALLFRCGWGVNAMRDDGQKAAMRQYASDFLAPLFSEKFNIGVSFDMGELWHPPKLWVDPHSFLFSCVDGVIDLAPLVDDAAIAALPPRRRNVVQNFLSVVGKRLHHHMRLIDFISALAADMHSSKVVRIVFAEVCFSLGFRVESKLADHTSSCAEVLRSSSSSTPFALSPSSASASAHHRDQVLARYFEGCSELTKGLQCFSIAVDASRIGKKGLHLGIFCEPGGLAFWMVPQVMKDYEVVAPVGSEPGLSEPARFTQHKEGLLKRCRAWLRRDLNKPSEENWRPKKKRRVKSALWAHAVDSQLRLASQHELSLDALVQPEDEAERSSSFSWVSASLCADQGPDGVCGAGWLQREARCNLDVIWDLSHLASNAWKAGMAQAKLMPFHRLMTVAWNARHGPWQEGVRWGQATETMRAHVELVDHTECSLFNELLPKILDDERRPECIHQSGIERDVWMDLCDGLPWRRRGSAVSDTRFFASLREARAEDKVWHCRLYAYLLACLEFDLLRGSKLADFFQYKRATPVVKSAAQSEQNQLGLKSAAQSNEAAMRAACANLLVLATMMYSSDTNQYLERIVVCVSGPLEAWHSDQNKSLRQAQASIKWSTSQLKGGLMSTCNDIAASLADPVELSRCGFKVLSDKTAYGRFVHNSSEDVLVRIGEGEGDLASAMGSLCLALLGNFLSRLAWFYRGWPMGSVKMLDPSMRNEALAQLQADRSNYNTLKASVDPTHVILAKRSVFELLPVQQLCGMVDEEGGWSQKLEQALIMKHSRIMATQGVEDGFHTSRDLETGSMSKVALPRACFEALMNSKVLADRHSYRTPDFVNRPLQRNAKIPDTAFYGKTSDISARDGTESKSKLDMRKMVGHGQASWYSPGAASLNVPYYDLEMLQYLAESRQMSSASKAWLSCLLDGSNLLVRRRTQAPPQWYFALGGGDNTATVVWPAVQHTVLPGGQRSFSPSSASTQVHFATVVDLDDWEAFVYEWASPFSAIRSFPRAFADEPPAVRAITTDGAPKPLLVRAAEAAFWRFPLSRCKAIAAHLEQEVKPGADLCEVLTQLVSFVLKIGEEQALEIVGKRVSSLDPQGQAAYSELLECNEALYHMSKDDEKAIRDDQKEVKTNEQRAGNFYTSWASQLRKARGVKGNSLSAAAKKKILKDAKVELANVPDGDVLEADARKMLPPGGSIWREHRDGIWRGRVLDEARVSKATLSVGSREAARYVLQALWRKWLQLKLLTTDDCPVKGLFPAPSATAAASSSA